MILRGEWSKKGISTMVGKFLVKTIKKFFNEILKNLTVFKKHLKKVKNFTSI